MKGIEARITFFHAKVGKGNVKDMMWLTDGWWKLEVPENFFEACDVIKVVNTDANEVMFVHVNDYERVMSELEKTQDELRLLTERHSSLENILAGLDGLPE